MPLFGLLIALILQQPAPARPPRDGAIHLNGHAYRLSCSFAGVSAPCIGKGGVEVDHFEVRDEAGRIQFELSSPKAKPFTDVSIGGFGNPGNQVLEISTSQELAGNGTPSQTESLVIYAFDPTPSGLVPFRPPVTCMKALLLDLSFRSGIALGCIFNTGYFAFTVPLAYNFSNHQLGLMSEQKVFSIFEPETKEPLKVVASAQLELYEDHAESALHSSLIITAGESIELLLAWAPVSMEPVNSFSPGLQAVNFNRKNVWLKMKVNGRMGWIRGDESFKAIGLPAASANE